MNTNSISIGGNTQKLSHIFDQNREAQLTSSVLRFIYNRLGSSIVSNWFKGTQISFDNKGIATMFFPNQFVHDWVLNHYHDAIQDAFQAICKTRVFNTAILNQVTDEKKGELSSNSLPLDANMRFETFVVGKANEMAFESAKKISTDPGQQFNPFFLYGSSGFGKTHLLQAIAWHAKENGKKVCYVSAEQYMLTFIKAIRSGKDGTMEFKESFRHTDYLIIEDFQFMAGKDCTQEEIFYNFVDLISKKKQLIVSADKKPCELSGIEKRLKTRLGGGLTVYIHPAPFELRFAILQQKAKQYNKKIDESVLNMLAERVDTNIRELEGALTRICAQMDFFGKQINLDLAFSALDEMLNTSTKTVSTAMILDAVCEACKIQKDVLLSTSRLKHIVKARQIAILLCRDISKKSLPEIGKIFGGKDHTTALYAIRIMREKMTKMPELAREIEKIKASLYRRDAR